jgi:hypothetical protein
MTIILTTQPNLSDDKTLNILGDFGDAVGIPGFPQPNRDRGARNAFDAVQSDINNVIDKLTGRSNQEQFDPSYVGDGRQRIPGGTVQGGKVPPLEEANVRQVYSQTPHISVIVKKKAFSGLSHLYDTTFMDKAEQWLLRSIKRMVAAKCETMALYERLTKAQRLEDLGAKPGLILASLISSLAEDLGQVDYFTSAMQLQRTMADRQPPEVTTYHVDAAFPIVENLGPGIGVFELTSVSGVNTNLNLEGSGTASFEIEDPYRILIVTEHDIETAIRDSALSRFVDAVSTAAGLSLSTAQSSDSILQKTRQSNGKSAITFSVGVGSNSGVTATIDAIGFEITENNLGDVPEPHTLSDEEETLFKSVMSNLKNYEFAMRKNLLSGLGNLNSQELKEQVRYVREKLRLYHMGKAIIQPTDSVHIYIDGGTRRLGETGDVEDPNEKFNLTTVTGALSAAGNILGLQNEAQVDDDLLRIEWRKEGQHMKFKDFRVLRTLQGSGEGGTHVFGGMVNSVTDKYDASSGKFTLSVSCGSNMEWLKLSRFNQSPSLKQVQGIVYDPLTPFKIEVDKATGLPTGKPEWLDENQQILNSPKNKPKIYFNNGEKVGTQLKTEDDAAQDIRQAGGNILTLYQHAPGLVYRWKPGIMTATYNMATVDPKDGTAVSYKQLRREVGFYSSNTPFDNMDAANIISLLVTGRPYDPVRFVQSALQTGSFAVDSTYNDFRHYFHTFLDVQQSINFVQGNFSPFKTYNVSPKTFADGISLQQQLTNKSSRLMQLRTQLADLEDKYYAIKDASSPIKKGLSPKISSLRTQISALITEINGDSNDATNLKGSALYVAGNDITFDLLGGDNNVKLFGDRLRHASLRRREDVIRGRDSNYLIVSDEYDKDYDIQAFVLKLKEQSPELWRSDWNDMLSICQEVAKTLNFEFFCDTQGHIVFRPPQYNRTPATVFNNLFSMEQSSGIGILPDFLKKLFLSREQAILKEIIILEWELILKAAILGCENEYVAQELLGNNDVFVYNNFSTVSEIAQRNFAQSPSERKSLQFEVQRANKSIQLGNGLKGGAFTPKSQVNLQKEVLKNDRLYREYIGDVAGVGSEDLYNKARSRLTQLRGTKLSSIPEYSKARVGVSKNGQRRPASDIASAISDVSNIISRRSKLLLLLEKVINQNIEVANMDSNGQVKFSPEGLISTNYKNISSVYDQLIEDDTKNVLGHMSGERFVIKDEYILNASFEENPADMTTVQVNGTEPIVGGSGSLADVPVYTAFGTDFDLWRQYGWRGDKSFEKPFFWSAELQCAPYAVMLLSRQRRNIVQGTVTLMGNEYYQLGDVVYITHRNMLYYVDSVQHSFSYNNSFTTTLHLKYGHPPGEYIPTPLDVIGKGLVTKGRSHSAYRVRRETPVEDTVLGVIEFQKNSNHLLKGPKGRRNFEELKRVALIARQYIGKSADSSSSPRIYIISFGGDENDQDTRAQGIRSWFNSPYAPGQPSGGIGVSGLGDLPNPTDLSTEDKEIMEYQINGAFLKVEHVNQAQEYENLSPSEKELIRSGLVAGQKTISIDRTLENVIEIRLRQPPVGGWKRNDS